jgi:ferredoxin
VDRFLRERPLSGPPKRFNSAIGRIAETEHAEFMKGVDPGPRVAGDRRDARGLDDESARREAGRCMHCDCRKADACRLRDYSEAYGARQAHFKGVSRKPFASIREHPRVIYEPGKCVACGICVRITRKAGAALGLAFEGRGFGVRVSAPFDASLAAALEETAAACVEACPTGALADAGLPSTADEPRS